MNPRSAGAPCIVVAGTHSGVGKTTIAIALMCAYARRGLQVQAFKVGPDFIDPGYHRATTRRPSHNLDGWMLPRAVNMDIYRRASESADLCIVEGVMGLFDGSSPHNDSGSTAEIAKWLNAPVLLIADGSAMARSAAALVHGFESFDSRIDVAGVIFNRVSGEGHYAYLRDSVRANCAAAVLGYLPPQSDVALPERYLGLHLAEETLNGDSLTDLAGWIERTVDLGAISSLARPAGPVTSDLCNSSPLQAHADVRIAVAKDRAFQFYYEENLESLRNLGAEIVEFSPICDRSLPENVDALYIGGGYPELYAAELAANNSVQQSIREFSVAGAPIYAECGGFMYLTEAIVDQSGKEHPMCAIFPTRARMQDRLAGFGYAEVEVQGDASWLPSERILRGHQFRHSNIDPVPPSVRRVYTRVNSAVTGSEVDAFLVGATVGSYFHHHFGSCPHFAEKFVQAARCFAREAHART